MLPTRELAIWILLLASSCSSGRPYYGGEDDLLLRCAQWNKHPPTIDNIYAGCMEPDNQYEKAHYTRCEDGRTMFWTRVNWGYVGELAQGLDLDQGPPASAIEECG